MEIKLFYNKTTSTEGVYNAVLILNASNIVGYYTEYKSKYRWIKPITIQDTQNIFELAEKKIPFYIVGSTNAESGKMEYNIITDVNELELMDVTTVFVIDEARID